MRGIYSKASHSIKELPEMEQPHKYFSALGGILNEFYPAQEAAYNAHIASLRKIQCGIEFFGVDQNIYEEGVDYSVVCSMGGGPLECKSPHCEYHNCSPVAIPLKKEEDQDELWKEAVKHLKEFHVADNWVDRMKGLYSIHRK